MDTCVAGVGMTPTQSTYAISVATGGTTLSPLAEVTSAQLASPIIFLNISDYKTGKANGQ